MILIRYQDLSNSSMATWVARLVHADKRFGFLPGPIQKAMRWIGKLWLPGITKHDNPLLEDNLTRGLGLTRDDARIALKHYRAHRCARFILDELLRQRYFEQYTISTQVIGELPEPGTGALFALMHTVEPYLLPALVGGDLIRQGSDKVYLLRAPLSGQEDQQFQLLSNWTGIEGKAIFLDPHASNSIKTAIRALRKGDHLLSYIDMPAQFGRSSPVSFLGRRAWLALGALDVARMARAPVYLVYITRDPNDRLNLTVTYEAVEAPANQMAQSVVTRIEDIVQCAPSDWDFVASLRSYFYLPGDRVPT